jgi:S-adenosylmethionine-diacylgycerolhomoserine-N-methlytransferase
LPNWFREGLFAWLNCFSVTPRLDLCEHLNSLTHSVDQSCRFRKLYGGYAMLGELHIH